MSEHNWWTGDQRDHPPPCQHKPPRSTEGALGMLDFCRCGAVRFVLRYSGNDGSGTIRRGWDRW